MAKYVQTGKMTQLTPVVDYPDPDVLHRLMIMENGFIFDPLLGKSYSTTQNGLVILRHMQSGASIEQIVNILSKDFNVSRDVIERDIIEFIGSLHGLLK